MMQTCSKCGGPKGGPGVPLYSDPRCPRCIKMDDLDGVKSPRGTRPLTHEEMDAITPKGPLPVDPRAEEFGLPAGMQIHWKNGHDWRCGCCNKMQDGDNGQIYISDAIRKGDSLKAIDGKMRSGWYSGGGTAWCIPCVQELCGVEKKPSFTVVDAGLIAGIVLAFCWLVLR